MRNCLVAGNWKMNGSHASITLLLEALIQGSQKLTHIELAVFPPFVFLEYTRRLLQNSSIVWGAQDLCSEESGAYTGEISAAMLKEFACNYVIVGHSERRTLYNETDQQVAAKFVTALRRDLCPILCVGETAIQHEQGMTFSIVERQLAVALKLADNLPGLSRAVVAYEPIWAIGTGKNATPEQVQAVHEAIRTQLIRYNKENGSAMRIIYGGSVKPDNAASLLAMKDIDGVLVGGASLKAEQFLEIAKSCKN